MNPYVEVLIRTFAAFAIVMLIAKILGKPTISQMTYHDFVTAITLGAITGNLALNIKLNPWYIVVSLLFYGGIAFLFTLISLKSRQSRKWLSGKPTVVIENGKILEQNLKKLRLTLDTLNQELREKDVFDIGEVEYAVLELNGRVTVLKKPEYQPILMKDLQKLGLTAKPQPAKPSFPVELIMDGKLVSKNLAHAQVTETWLMDELSRRRLTPPDVCYAVKGTDGRLYIDLFEDRIKQPIDLE
jgi:uncharacterized membrane protein YcaP (DUF421 family)